MTEWPTDKPAKCGDCFWWQPEINLGLDNAGSCHWSHLVNDKGRYSYCRHWTDTKAIPSPKPDFEAREARMVGKNPLDSHPPP